MTTLYLSSTYEDLKEYREVVYKALRKSGYDVIAMEDYVATDQRPVNKCLADVRKADIYLGIFAFRYGYVPPQSHGTPAKLSVTELEFREAESLKKPVLTFVVNEDTPWPPKFDDARAAEDKGERINTVRQYLLTEKLASHFSSPHELAALVLAAVAKHREENNKMEEATRQGIATTPAITWDINKKGSPYPGLMHFTRTYAPVFFGREAEVREILDRMRTPEGRFLIISGGSGTGKSSVVDAGVLPRIEESGIGKESRCVCARMIPSQGSDPFDALLRPLHAYAERAGLNVYDLAEQMRAQPNILPEKIQEIVLKGMNGDGLVLFLDQMEELFTAQNPEVSNRFLTALFEATQKGSLRVLATIRSDHLHHCHPHPEMLRILRGPGHYPLGPVEPFMLPDTIVKPAQCAGLSINETLARRIVHDAGAEPGGLPLLAFVLNQLFEKRSDRDLNEAVYETLGGVTGAIAQHAGSVEATIHRKLGGKASDLLPKLFPYLVIVKEEGLPTRRRPLLADLPMEMEKLIDLLVQGRLLHTEGAGITATVSLSHEKLFEAWPSLRDYVAANKKQLMDQTLLESRTRKWVEMGKPWFSGLVSGREYRDFQRRKLTATQEMTDYLNASRRADWFRKGVTGLAIFLIGVTGWLWQNGYTLDQALHKVQSIVVSRPIEPEMVAVPAGRFRQGDSGIGTSYGQPVREVAITAFSMGKYEVTFEEYDRFAIATGSRLPGDQGWGRGRRPVINVSWDDAVAYAKWLSKATGKRYRLPTESEWEYAARGGGRDEIWAGTTDPKELAEYAVFAGNSQKRTAVVGGKKPNGLGLYDMSGNLWEWVEDCAHEDYGNAPTDGSAWLGASGGDCGLRVIRGGSWGDTPEFLRTFYRDKDTAGDRGNGLGFRLAQDSK